MTGASLYIVAGGIALGVAGVLVFHAGFVCGIALLLCGLCALLVAILGKRPTVFLAVMLCAAAALGILRADAVLQSAADETLPSYVDASASVVGIVSDDPDRRETSQHLTVEVQQVNGVLANGTLLALVNRDASVSYGDTVTVKGPLTLPETFETDTGHTFDHPAYLRVRGISVQMQKASLVHVTPGHWSVQRFLFALKHSFEQSLERVMQEPEGSLLEGILLGERHGISKELTNAFIASGLVHVVVLSGYNISIVSEAVFRSLSFLPRVFNFSLGAILMIAFALLSGGGATTIRACIMALIALLARYLHRSSVALRSLVIAAAAMILWNPLVLLFDPSFILSVLATFGLITLSPWVESRLPAFLTKYESVRSIAASTISVQIYVLPALLYFTGVLSFLSVPANVLGLPVVPMAMLFGFIAGVVAFVSPALALLPALATTILLRYMMLVAQTTAAIPFGVAVVPEFSAWIVALLYIPLTIFAVGKYRQTLA